METTHDLLRYYADRHCPRQWSSFLYSLAQELESAAAQDELRPFMREVGKRMATQMPLPEVGALEELQAAINQQWDRIGWGWVSLEERPTHLVIKHSAAPLRAAFGASSLSWSPALLEGIYERWFALAGAGEGLSVVQHQHPPNSVDTVVFEFHLSSTSPNKISQEQ